MIPRLARSRLPSPRQPEWPELSPRQHSGALFEERPALRKLVVLIDAELLPPASAPFSPELLLAGLLTHPYVKFLRYGDDGPPSGTPRRLYGPATVGQNAGEAWAELLPPDGGDGRWLLCDVDATSPAYAAVWGRRAEFARHDTSPAVHRDLDPFASADRRERDGLAAEVVEAVKADLFITERPYLFETGAAIAQGLPTVARFIGVDQFS